MAGPPDPVAETLIPFFEGRPEIAAAYLFGSEARGRARPDSDVDVAVLLVEDPPRTYAGLPLDLEGEVERLLRRPVDLVALNHAPVDLVHEVLRHGRLLVDNQPRRRVQFEVRARAEYLDLLPILARYRRMPLPR